jgi:transcriptional regulator with XRE-family HTH domain
MIDKARQQFGQHVVRLRRQSMLSQEQLAELAQLKPATVRNIERGAFNVSFDVMNRIAVVLGGELQIIINDLTENNYGTTQMDIESTQPACIACNGMR